MPPVVATPNVLSDPGFLWVAPLGTAAPTNTVTAGKFSDTVAAAYIPLGATTEGSTFTYGTEVKAIEAAEFFDPIRYATVSRSGSISFALMNFTLSNYRRALNGGIAALVPTGVAGSELTVFEPPDPGTEVRSMLLWESTDSTVRMLFRQVLQGGEIETAFGKAPSVAAIPCTYNLEVPSVGKPFSIYGAGLTRV